MNFKPFYYQRDAVNTFITFITNKSNKGKYPLIVAPTGSGKSHIIALMCQEVLKKWPNTKIVILSHTKDILVQDYEKLLKYIDDPSKLGLYSAGLDKREVKQITVAGIQSVFSLKENFKETNLVIVDEAHTIPASGEGRYRTFFANINPQVIVGLTATPYRLGVGLLTDPKHIFHSVIYEINIRRLINEGFLSKIKSKATHNKMSTKGVKIVAGDYSAKSLSEKFDRTNITDNICQELSLYKEKRKHWLVFAIDIDHAEHIALKLNEYGISAISVHSKQENKINDLVLDMYKKGKIQAIVNVEKYTTGFDYPGIDMIVLLRPTKSPVLHVQMIGRGLRTVYNTESIKNFDICSKEHRLAAITASEKHDCLILDFARNIERVGPIDKIEPPKAKGKGNGVVPTKECPECQEILLLQAKECSECGYIFPVNEKLTLMASNASVLSEVRPPEEFDVKHVYYHKHINKEGTSLKISYMCNMLQTYVEWVNFEKETSKSLANRWWKFRAGTKTPTSTEEALNRLLELDTPKKIEVDLNGKYPKITRYHFGYNPELADVRRSISKPKELTITNE